MAYQYYRQNVPGWGTSQFQFGTPPPLGYQPLDSWRGLDYYHAHVMDRGAHYDPSFYQNVVNRVQVGGTAGYNLYEAKHWHRRAYGGFGELGQMLPAEIGAAAAYEAWRQYRHNMSQYDYLTPVSARREALFGLAVAEAVHLWQVAGRGFDQYCTSVAAEIATATIARILSETEYSLGADTSPGMSAGGFVVPGTTGSDGYYRGRARRGSVSEYDESPYARGRRLSRSPMPSQAWLYPPAYAGTSPIAVPISSPVVYGGGGSPYGGGLSLYAGGGLPYAGGGPPIVTTQAYPSSLVYPSSVYGGAYQVPSYTGQYVPSSTAAYAAAYGSGAYGQQPIVVIPGSGHRHHRHRNHSHPQHHRSLVRYGGHMRIERGR